MQGRRAPFSHFLFESANRQGPPGHAYFALCERFLILESSGSLIGWQNNPKKEIPAIRTHLNIEVRKKSFFYTNREECCLCQLFVTFSMYSMHLSCVSTGLTKDALKNYVCPDKKYTY